MDKSAIMIFAIAAILFVGSVLLLIALSHPRASRDHPLQGSGTKTGSKPRSKDRQLTRRTSFLSPKE
jgi:hypothetical protein